MFNYSREFFRKRERQYGIINTNDYSKDNELEIKTKGIDENKVTFIYVANKKCWNKTKNGESYKLNIKDIEHAHGTDYKPKVQLLQTKDDDDDGEIVTFKQVRYTVKTDFKVVSL